jgi:hypothetical protein
MELPPLLLGSSPFIGAGQFGFKSLLYYRRFYLNPENMVRLFLKSFELGVEAVQLLADRPIDAVLEASKRSGVKPYVVYSTHLSGRDLRRILDRLSPLEPEMVAVHAEVADRRDVHAILRRLEIIGEYGAVGALATHRPGSTLPWLGKVDLPIETVLTPLNRLGYAMEPSFEESLDAIERCRLKVIAIKPLAAGHLKPQEAFNFIYQYADSAAVGIVSEEEMEETYEAARRALRSMGRGPSP